MTVADSIRAEIARLEAELAALPAEAHNLETEVWAKIKAFFHQNPSAAAAPELGQPASSAPAAPPAP